jgi:hypothetical protein
VYSKPERHGISEEVKEIFNLPNISSQRWTQPLIQISTKNLPEGKARQGRKADNFAAICEPIF